MPTLDEIGSARPPPAENASQADTGRTGHKNIRFNPKMDEWSILARLQDFEDEKKRKLEND